MAGAQVSVVASERSRDESRAARRAPSPASGRLARFFAAL